MDFAGYFSFFFWKKGALGGVYSVLYEFGFLIFLESSEEGPYTNFLCVGSFSLA